jgi:hypothetical protein
MNSEDTYWSRYSIIQGNIDLCSNFLLIAWIGSADSTIPSPPPVQSVESEVNSITKLEQNQERVIVSPTEFQVHHVKPYDSLEPPSPAEISRRLKALSSEPATLLPPRTDEPHSDSETLFPHHAEIDAFPNIVDKSILQIPSDNRDAFRMVLQDTIGNLYKLWRMNRQDKSAERDKDIFINAIQHALEEL